MQEFTVKDLLKIFKKWWMLLTVLPLIVALIVSYYNYNYINDVYMARTSMFLLLDYIDTVGNRRIDTNISKDFSQNMKELFNRSDILRKTAEAMNMPDITSRVTFRFSVVSETSIIEISATGGDPKLCMEAANTASEMFIAYANDMLQKQCAYITQYAGTPRTPISPNRTQNIMMGTLISLLLSISGVVLLELFNMRIKTESQIEDGLHQPVLGTIPDFRAKLKVYEKERIPPSQGLTCYMDELEKESFKAMTTNISFITVNPTVKTIAITSASPDDCMNAFALLTADAFAETGKNVLIVDMDFRNQSLGEYLRIRPTQDLVDHLAGRSTIDEIIMPTSIYNVSFVGNNHSLGLFTRVVESKGFTEFLERLESLFDIILFTTPSLNLYIDAAILASKVGGVVVTVPNNRIDVKHAQVVLEKLKRGGATILGMVLNYVRLEEADMYIKNKKKTNHKKRD